MLRTAILRASAHTKVLNLQLACWGVLGTRADAAAQCDLEAECREQRSARVDAATQCDLEAEGREQCAAEPGHKVSEEGKDGRTSCSRMVTHTPLLMWGR